MEPQVLSLFETPLLADMLPGHETINPQLAATIRARRAQDPAGMQRSNRLGWHSDTAMLDWGGPAFRPLIERAIAIANAQTVDIRPKGATPFSWYAEAWANVSAHGGSNQFHCHAGAYWSAVYYVDDGYAGSADRALGGELTLEDPRMPAMLMEQPGLRLRPRPEDPLAEPDQLVRPRSGQLLMFPAWLRHGVRPYLGPGERISIAINLIAIRPAG
ncbi:TIGR02466 family protein [Rhizorhabdus dicambivorans]|uniref:Fe2OG dioxygenase domain-containing protein n=1 Tax=Rhizorhabdus dicambivorans TaxID=1850238 RepID=A0A2A4G1K7_9SPHN|nr:TIGR02466 family protein [Rhizorhabdus dicambivorans]ATE63448.1 hypothetical protein CMV14_02720 [Rhizorhabdus dicambivorans]PCE43667.1 hypothetical protein COO09_05040 [Rhizorhabdus dicambivorans]